MKKLIIIAILLLLLSINACQPSPAGSPTNTPDRSELPTELAQVETITTEPIVYEPVTLKFNAAKLPSCAPIYLAEKEGYFEQFGK